MGGSTRWWEFYVVRYGTGTVVGGVVFFLICILQPSLHPLLFGADEGTLDAPRLVLFGAYGLAYCYLASAPILVLHAGRFLLAFSQPATDTIRRSLILVAVPLVLTMMAYDNLPGSVVRDTKLFYAAATFVFAMVVVPQFILVLLAGSRTDALYAFYLKLDKKRRANKGELVDSYRHLREHGNSFFIVFFEMALGVVLVAVGDAAPLFLGSQPTNLAVATLPYAVVLLLWTFPAVLVWYLGTAFERRFADGP